MSHNHIRYIFGFSCTSRFIAKTKTIIPKGVGTKKKTNELVWSISGGSNILIFYIFLDHAVKNLHKADILKSLKFLFKPKEDISKKCKK